MLVFVDYEHADGYLDVHGDQMLAARTRITYRLEDVAGRHCHLVRYDRVDEGLLRTLQASAIFISGNSRDPDDYDPDLVAPVHALLRETELPIFGFCGGFQLIAQAFGADIVPITGDSGQRDDPMVVRLDDPMVVRLDDGRPFEYGYHPIDVAPVASRHPLVAGLGRRPVFRHAHGLHVPNPPEGFETMASTATTPVQLAVHDQRRIVGTQFHPEYWTDEHPAGRTLIANFLAWSGVRARG